MPVVVIALVAAALLGQAAPDPGAPPAATGRTETAPAEAPPAAVAPAEGGPAVVITPPEPPAQAPPPTPDDSVRDGSVELGIAVAPRADERDLEAVLSAGIDYVPWHLGAARAGLRLGAMLGGTRGACPGDAECAFAGFYAGPLVRIAPLHGKAFSPWVEIGVTPFVATGLEFEDQTLVGIELPRIGAGFDVVLGNLRIGLSAFHSRTPYHADISDGAVVMWGSTLRFMWGVRG